MKTKQASKRKRGRQLRSTGIVRMPGPAISTVRSHLRRLRKLIDESKDPHEQRIGYAMETAIRWAREDTVGWGDMAKEARTMAAYLKRETGQS